MTNRKKIIIIKHQKGDVTERIEGKVFKSEESTFGFVAGEWWDSRTKPGEDVWKGSGEWRDGAAAALGRRRRR